MNSLSMVFPGQGSQSVGMLVDIAAEFNEVTTIFIEASDVLHLDLWKLVKEGPKEKLDQTMHTQPALLTASYAIWQILRNRANIQPSILAGHSLGEYTALLCAKVMTFSDALLLVAARGQYMQEAVPTGVGAMAAIIGLDEVILQDICQQAMQLKKGTVSAANFNSIGQIVVAGHTACVHQVIELAKQQGAAMAILLPVSVPSHCSLMQPAAERLADLLNKINLADPKLTVINNVHALPYRTKNDIREGLIQQLCQPVRWVEIIQHLVKAGTTTVIECGPGKVLTGLNKRIDQTLSLLPTFNAVSIKNILQESERRG